MRSLKTKLEEKKEQKRNQVILGVVLIFVMFFSTLGYAFQGFFGENTDDSLGQNVIDYNGFEFTDLGGFWITDFQGSSLIFKNNPSQTKYLNIDLFNQLSNYQGKPLYIYSQDVSASSELRTNLANFVLRVNSACLQGENCNADDVIKTCEDNFILIREAKEDRIYSENNCVFIEGNLNNLTELTDSFLFKLFGIVQ